METVLWTVYFVVTVLLIIAVGFFNSDDDFLYDLDDGDIVPLFFCVVAVMLWPVIAIAILAISPFVFLIWIGYTLGRKWKGK